MRAQRLFGWLTVGVAAAAAAGPPDDASNVRDLYFGEALYYAQQGHFFDALERLDAELGQHRAVDEPALDSLYHSLREAEFSVGDFELNYRMHHRAGRAITAVLEGAVDEDVRNDAAYRLARIHFQKGQLEDALHAARAAHFDESGGACDYTALARRPPPAICGATCASKTRVPGWCCRASSTGTPMTSAASKARSSSRSHGSTRTSSSWSTGAAAA